MIFDVIHRMFRPFDRHAVTISLFRAFGTRAFIPALTGGVFRPDFYKLYLAMLNQGVDYMSGGTLYLNAAISEGDVDRIVHAFDRSLVKLKEEKLL